MMRIAIGSTTLSITMWSSFHEARAAAKGEVVLVNEDSLGVGPVYEIAQFTDSPDFSPGQVIYLQTESDSSVPTVLGMEWAGERWIGCNSHLYVLSPALEVSRSIDLEEPFASFYVHGSRAMLFVTSETGIWAFSADGDLNWKSSFDVITGVRWHDGFVLVGQMDGPEVVVDLANGKSKQHIRENQ